MCCFSIPVKGLCYIRNSAILSGNQQNGYSKTLFFLIKTMLWFSFFYPLSWIHTRTQAFFYRFVACAFPFFEVKSVVPIDRYQNATSKAISLRELKKVKLQEQYTLVTHDSIGHLKTLCMSVLSLVVALESEWKRYNSSQSNKKTLAF